MRKSVKIRKIIFEVLYDIHNKNFLYEQSLKDNTKSFYLEKKDSCRRFISLIDMLYENNCSIVILASKPINSLNNIVNLAEEFKRTASRLYEMTIVQPTK